MWHPANEGRDRHYTWALGVDPDDPDLWYVSAAPGPREAHGDDRDAQAQIYRWSDGGPWELTGIPQPLGSMPYALLHTPQGLVCGLRDGRIFVGKDRGAHWHQVELTGQRLMGIRAMAAGSTTEYRTPPPEWLASPRGPTRPARLA